MAVSGSLVDCAEEGSDGATCEVRLLLGAQPPVAETEGIDLHMVLRADLSCENAMERDKWRQFGEMQLVLIAWPYLREIVSDVTSRMGLPPLVLPLLVVPTQGIPADDETLSTELLDHQVDSGQVAEEDAD